MEIKTKFNIGDVVWTCKDRAIVKFKIYEIEINVSNDKDLYINYAGYGQDDEKYTYADNCFCFATKEELLASL